MVALLAGGEPTGVVLVLVLVLVRVRVMEETAGDLVTTAMAGDLEILGATLDMVASLVEALPQEALRVKVTQRATKAGVLTKARRDLERVTLILLVSTKALLVTVGETEVTMKVSLDTTRALLVTTGVVEMTTKAHLAIAGETEAATRAPKALARASTVNRVDPVTIGAVDPTTRVLEALEREAPVVAGVTVTTMEALMKVLEVIRALPEAAGEETTRIMEGTTRAAAAGDFVLERPLVIVDCVMMVGLSVLFALTHSFDVIIDLL
jgi:hypothetical protein